MYVRRVCTVSPLFMTPTVRVQVTDIWMRTLVSLALACWPAGRIEECGKQHTSRRTEPYRSLSLVRVCTVRCDKDAFHIDDDLRNASLHTSLPEFGPGSAKGIRIHTVLAMPGFPCGEVRDGTIKVEGCAMADATLSNASHGPREARYHLTIPKSVQVQDRTYCQSQEGFEIC